jgi:hypothetical protein
MAGVLTEESTVGCGHGPGKVATAGEARLTVNGHPVLTKQSVEGKAVTATPCGIVLDGTTNNVKCLQVTSVDNTEATRLRIGGKAVLVDPLGGATNGTKGGNPTKDLTATVGQTRLTAE